MKWKNILKVQELKPITAVLPKTEDEPEEDDGPCNRKLKEYAAKLKNTMDFKGKFEDGDKIWENLYLQAAYRNPEESGVGWGYTHSAESNVIWIHASPVRPNQPHGEISNMNKNAWERTIFTYNPIPEKVACAALKLLNGKITDGRWVGDYRIKVYSNEEDLNSNTIFRRTALEIKEKGTHKDEVVMLSHIKALNKIDVWDIPHHQRSWRHNAELKIVNIFNDNQGVDWV